MSEQLEIPEPRVRRRFRLIPWRLLLTTFFWWAGALLPAVMMNGLAWVGDQAKYGETEQIQAKFAAWEPIAEQAYLYSLGLSVLLMCGAIAATRWSLPTKLFLAVASLGAILLFTCLGVLVSFGVTGLPVE